MPSIPIRIDTEVVNELRKLTTYSGISGNIRPSYSATIRKLIRDSLELRRIEQTAMKMVDSTIESLKLSKSPIIVPRSASKKSYKKSHNTIHLFCFECQTQTPHRKLKTGEWKCSQCGSKRNI